MLEAVPATVFVVKVGDTFFVEDDEVNAFVKREGAESYLEFIQPFPDSAMRVCEVPIEDLWWVTGVRAIYVAGEQLMDEGATCH